VLGTSYGTKKTYPRGAWYLRNHHGIDDHINDVGLKLIEDIYMIFGFWTPWCT
jgi:hypothetical protein